MKRAVKNKNGLIEEFIDVKFVKLFTNLNEFFW